MSKSRHRQLGAGCLLATTLTLLACQSDSLGPGRDSTPVPGGPADTAAVLGSSGGTLTIGLPGGGAARLALPVGALTGDTLVRLVALPSADGERARFRIEPAGLLLQQPAELRLTLREAPRASDEIAMRSGTQLLILPTTRSGLTLAAPLRELSFPPSQAAPIVPGAMAVFANAEDASGEIVVSSFEINSKLATLDALATAAIRDPIAQAQLRLNLQLAAIVGDRAFSTQVATNVLNILCEQYFNALRDLTADPMTRISAYRERVLPVNQLWGAIQKAEGLTAVSGCVQGEVSPIALLEAAGTRYFTFLESRLSTANFQAEFVDWWRDGFQPIVAFAAQLQLLGLSIENRRTVIELGTELYDRLRSAGFSVCVASGDQTYPRLLLDAEAVFGEPGDIFLDVEYCATRVSWQVVANDDEVEAAGVIGRNDVNFRFPVMQGTGSLRYGGVLSISGDARVIRCRDRASNDRIVLRLGNVDLVTLQPNSAGQMIPPEGWSISIDTIAVRAGQQVARSGIVDVVIEREGSSCGAGIIGERYELGRLTFALQEGIRISMSPLPTPFLDEPYDHTMSALNTADEVTWDVVDGEMPFGLVLAPNGQITGTPTGTPDDPTVVTIRATERNVRTQEDFIVVMRLSPLRITTESLAEAARGEFYTQTLFVNRPSTAAVTWSISNGSLPDGLSLSQTGSISGTPTTAGTRNFTVRAAVGSDVATRQFTIVVSATAGFSILNESFPDAETGEPYIEGLLSTLELGEGVWSVSAGALPPGLSIVPGMFGAAITGTPTTPGEYGFTLRLTYEGESVTRAFSIRVVTPPLSVPGFSLSAPLGYGVTSQIPFVGGSGGVNVVVTGGSLPPGLTMSPTGAITGIATAEGLFSFSVRVTRGGETVDGGGSILVVRGPLAIFTTQVRFTVQILQPGQEFTLQRWRIAVSGGNPPQNVFTLVAGTLPSGITLTPDGFLEGTQFGPLGERTIRVRVTDGFTTAERDILLIIDCCSSPF